MDFREANALRRKIVLVSLVVEEPDEVYLHVEIRYPSGKTAVEEHLLGDWALLFPFLVGGHGPSKT